jgi:hypothetical protein
MAIRPRCPLCASARITILISLHPHAFCSRCGTRWIQDGREQRAAHRRRRPAGAPPRQVRWQAGPEPQELMDDDRRFHVRNGLWVQPRNRSVPDVGRSGRVVDLRSAPGVQQRLCIELEGEFRDQTRPEAAYSQPIGLAGRRTLSTSPMVA